MRRVNSSGEKRKKPSTMKTTDRHHLSSHGVLRPNRPSFIECVCVPSVFNPTPLPTPRYPYQDLRYGYSGVICPSPQVRLCSPLLPQPLIATIQYKSNQQRHTHVYLPHQNPVMYSVSCLASHEKHSIALSTLLVTCFITRHSFACLHPVYWTGPIINQAHLYNALVGRPFAFPQRLRPIKPTRAKQTFVPVNHCATALE